MLYYIVMFIQESSVTIPEGLQQLHLILQGGKTSRRADGSGIGLQIVDVMATSVLLLCFKC